MIEKAKKRVLKLANKTCIICKREFKPGSGAQMTCSDACKAEAKKQGLTKRGPRSRSDVDTSLPEGESPLERMKRLDKENPIPSRSENGASNDKHEKVHAPEAPDDAASGEELPDIEMDMAPLARWIRQVVHHAVKNELADLAKETTPDIRAAVEEILREKFQGLLGK